MDSVIWYNLRTELFETPWDLELVCILESFRLFPDTAFYFSPMDERLEHSLIPLVRCRVAAIIEVQTHGTLGRSRDTDENDGN